MKAFRVRIDEAKCIGAGQCVLRAPRIFDQRDDGIVILLDATPPPELHAAARQAADLCPAEAITIVEDAA
ncbi:MAG TPA: ferredoxin [Casimicrobiaceae bacterium]|nr:ferredoxin [Casimicrobiaceae bacterium]